MSNVLIRAECGAGCDNGLIVVGPEVVLDALFVGRKAAKAGGFVSEVKPFVAIKASIAACASG